MHDVCYLICYCSAVWSGYLFSFLTANSSTSDFYRSFLCLCYISDMCVCVLSVKQKHTLLAWSKKYLPGRSWLSLILLSVQVQGCNVQLCRLLTVWAPGQGTSGGILQTPVHSLYYVLWSRSCLLGERGTFSSWLIYVCSDSADADSLEQMSNPGKELWNSK